LARKCFEYLHKQLFRHLNIPNILSFQNGYDFLKSRILFVRWGLLNRNIKFKERFWFKFKRTGDLGQVLQRDIAFAAFDTANIGIMEPAPFGKLILRKPFCFTVFSYF